MTRFPSVKTLMKGLGVNRLVAERIRLGCECSKGLAVANHYLNGCGIESIGLPEGCFDRCQDPEVDIRYVNLGDTYATTLCKVNGRYRVSSWGDIVEAWDRRHPHAVS